jgi:hypothetical protein
MIVVEVIELIVRIWRMGNVGDDAHGVPEFG